MSKHTPGPWSVRYLGYMVIETGGGCKAWFRFMRIAGEHSPCNVKVTTVDGIGIPDAWYIPVLAGLYRDDDTLIECREYQSIVAIPDVLEWQEIYDEIITQHKELEDNDENA